MKKTLVAVFLACVMIMSLAPIAAFAVNSDDIVILYENDMHCNIDGYAKIKAMKDELLETYSHVGVVSSGDYIQGSSLGAISQGEYIVNAMNLVGYDAVTLGNHEFDYRLTRLEALVDKMNTKPVSSNFQKIGESSSVFSPYTIVTYGDVKIAYLGVTTPSTITSSSPSQFMDENGDYIYSFNGTNLCETVQNHIDAAIAEGADYIVALTHLGTEDVSEIWSSQYLVSHTNGIDVVLDGHSHSVIEAMKVKNKDGKEVIITSTGSKFQNIGKLTISANGEITTQLIPTDSYEKVDNQISEYITEIKEEYAALGDRKIGTSEVFLTTVDENGNRIIRSEETNLGDFCADAFRVVTGADVGMINGGGIRDNISAGDVTFNDILSVFPWNNTVCVVKATGQQIIDMLELSVMYCPNENGTFQHVSGITFDIDISIPTTVILDEQERFVGVGGARRVSNVKILDKETNEYIPIDTEKEYSLASHNYLLLDQGGGATMFDNAEIIVNDGMLDVELLEVYITDYLSGNIGSEYATSQNRIVITDGTSETPTVGDNSDMVVMAIILVVSAFSATLCVKGKKQR